MRREWLNGLVSRGQACPFEVNLLSFRPDVKILRVRLRWSI